MMELMAQPLTKQSHTQTPPPAELFITGKVEAFNHGNTIHSDQREP